MRNSRYVVDPMPGGSQKAYFYPDTSGDNKTDGSVANPNNYLVVPANYSEQQARDFAAGITRLWHTAYPGDAIGGPNRALMAMTAAFTQGGSQDLQRHPQWGIPKGSIVPAFVGSASNHLGYVTAHTPVPMLLSEIGGGAANVSNAIYRRAKKGLGYDATNIAFSATLAGINPDDPSPPTWPPETDSQIRYLKRVTY
jgi:hypothetical protein